ncbi:hypothetical protein [Actinospica robiniae]|uniref:hypothetical protein n=1 Tax=Actinospica robiniae TaxID=304901 RepID=UPI0006859842|nr:hypothetical protein [Actinospica robiniae]
MYRAGELLSPQGEAHPEAVPRAGARRVDGTLGEVLTGAVPGRKSETDVILSNPFGMSVLDLAVAEPVFHVARDLGIGLRL